MKRNFQEAKSLLKVSSAALSLLGPDLVPCLYFMCLLSAACRTLIPLSKPCSNLTFSPMIAAFRLFHFRNWCTFRSHISFFSLPIYFSSWFHSSPYFYRTCFYADSICRSRRSSITLALGNTVPCLSGSRALSSVRSTNLHFRQTILHSFKAADTQHHVVSTITDLSFSFLIIDTKMYLLELKLPIGILLLTTYVNYSNVCCCSIENWLVSSFKNSANWLK